VSLVAISRKNPIFMKFGTVPNLAINFSKVNVEVQGQKRRIENLALVINSWVAI